MRNLRNCINMSHKISSRNKEQGCRGCDRGLDVIASTANILKNKLEVVT